MDFSFLRKNMVNCQLKPNKIINLDLIDCIIFVSKNGVRYFFENENTKKYDLSNKYFVCIGKKTANKLIKMGYKPGYICGKNYSMEMSKELKINKVLDVISENTIFLKILGSYPIAELD